MTLAPHQNLNLGSAGELLDSIFVYINSLWVSYSRARQEVYKQQNSGKGLAVFRIRFPLLTDRVLAGEIVPTWNGEACQLIRSLEEDVLQE